MRLIFFLRLTSARDICHILSIVIGKAATYRRKYIQMNAKITTQSTTFKSW